MKRALNRRGLRGGSLNIPREYCEKMHIEKGDFVVFHHQGAELICKNGGFSGYEVGASNGKGLIVSIPSSWIRENGLTLPCKVDIELYGKTLLIKAEV